MSDRPRVLKAIDRLATALSELAYTDRISITPDIRFMLIPDNATNSEVRHMHSLGLTPELAELLAEVIEQMVISRSVSETSDPFNAGVFALAKPELAAEISSAFDGIDLTELARQVLDTTTPNTRMTVTRALDDMFGDVTDQEAEGDE